MKLLLRGHEDRYALEQLQLCLFPDAPMEFVTQPFAGDGAVSALHRGKQYLTATARITLGGVTTRAFRRLPLAKETYALRRRLLQRSYYLAALPHLQQPPPWGALSGVRPTKLTTRHLLAGGTEESAARMMQEEYFVTEPRARLCAEASMASLRAAALLDGRDVSVYAGIAFCPTRCAYCSFVSQTAGSAGRLLTPYLDCLLREAETVGAGLRAANRTPRTLYIGGGTPTTLSAGQLSRLTEAIRCHFDLSRLIEYTVEAGRPDTVDPEKLRVLRDAGVTRVSINPQSMIASVLQRVGRPHTAADVERAFSQAAQAGFDRVNMDLIAGLPTDTPEGFETSLRRVLRLAPSEITVHTLALKKGAALFERREELPAQAAVARMVDTADALLREAGYHPYYLYRQKYMSGSFENVGWCREGAECLYNIYMMEELHSIVSLGAGGMSKLSTAPTKLERFHNPKFPKEYTERIEDVLEQKRALIARLRDIPPFTEGERHEN